MSPKIELVQVRSDGKNDQLGLPLRFSAPDSNSTLIVQMVKGSWIKPGAVVIDCGINSVPDPTKKSGKALVGDVDFEEAAKAGFFLCTLDFHPRGLA